MTNQKIIVLGRNEAMKQMLKKSGWKPNPRWANDQSKAKA